MSTEPTGSPSGTLFGVCLMVLMATLDMSIVNVSLPTLVKDLGTDFAAIQWVVLSYTLALTCLMLTVARLGDMYGKKMTYAWGLVIFTVASGLCGLAPNVESLIVFRGVQGVGAAMSQALGLAIVTEVIEPERRGRAIGIIGATVSIGLSAGPSVGGVLIGLLGWRSIFLINLPVGVAAWIVFMRSAPKIPPQDKGARFDLAGAVMLFVGLCCYCLGMTYGQNLGFGAPRVLVLLSAAVAAIVAFVLIQKRTRSPMLDLSVFKNALFTLNLLMSALVFMGLAGMFIIPFYLQFALGFNPTMVGVLMMATPLCMGLISPKAGALSDKYNPRYLCLFGLLLALGGALAMTTINAETDWLGYLLRIIPVGLGMGFFQAPNNTAVMSCAPRDRLGVASGLLNYTRVFGQTSGLPIMASLFSLLVLGYGSQAGGEGLALASVEKLAGGISGVYTLGAAIMALNVGLAVWAIILERKATCRL